MSHQSPGISRCQSGAQSRGDSRPLLRFSLRPGLDRKASNAWAMRIPTLRTMKNAAITSNIDGPCAIDALTKRSTFCTVKEIPLNG